MGCKGWLLGNSPNGLCFCTGLQAHPAVSRDCIAPEWTCGDGACTDLLPAGKVGCGLVVCVLAGLAALQQAEVRFGSEVKVLLVLPEVLVLKAVPAIS